MKKILTVVIVVLLLAGAGLYFYLKKSKSPVMPAQQSGNVFSSIQDALSKSLSMQCSFTDEQNRKTTAYIKAGAVRADMAGNDPAQQYNSSSVIIKDKKMYVWDAVKKQGMIIDLKNEQTTAPTGSVENQTGSSPQNAGDVMSALEKYKNDCKVAVVGDSLFTPPTDVTFQDLSKIMIPTSAVPSGVNQQDVQKMMQQYQQQIPQGSSGN